jgi:flagellar biosynthesis/type III secretory pathway M-ring protein FliF/YscJ
VEIFDAIILILKIVIGLTVFFVIIFVVVRPIISSFTETQRQLDQDPYHRAIRRQAIEEEELEIPTSREDNMTAENIIKIAKEDATKTTVVVRNWIQDKKPK